MKLNVPRIALATLVLLVMTFTLLIAGFTGGYLFISAFIQNREPLRAADISLTSMPPKQALCPGSQLDYIFGVQQLRTPVVARIVRTVVSLDENRQVITQDAGDVELRIWESLDGFKQPDSYQIPMTDSDGVPLEPGQYELRVAVVAESAAPSVVSLGFVLSDSCSSSTPL